MRKNLPQLSIAFSILLLVSCQRDIKPIMTPTSTGSPTLAPSSSGNPTPVAENKNEVTSTPFVDKKLAQLPLFAPAPESSIAVLGGPGNLTLGDVNQDGKPDLVVASGRDRSITVLLGQGDGRFRAGRGSPFKLPDSPNELVLRDLDSDGKLDLAIASHESYGVMLLLGDGNGGFVTAPNSPIIMKNGNHPHTHGLEAGDLNRDGKPDVVTSNLESDSVTVLLAP